MQSDKDAVLARERVNQFWQRESSSLAAMLEALDERESWTLDRTGEMVDQELSQMGDPSRYLSPEAIDRLDLNELSDMLSLLSFSRSIRMQRIFNDIKPDWLQAFSARVESTRDIPDGNVNYSRLRLLSQFMFLGAVFSPARMDMITDALYEVLDDEG